MEEHLEHDVLRGLRGTSSFTDVRDLYERPETKKGGNLAFREGTPEMHYMVARGELRNGTNLRHGVAHLADLVAFDPFEPEWLALIDEYDAAAPEGIEPLLDPTGGHQRYYATEALRAYVWARSGRVEEAIDLLLQIARVKPDRPFLDAWVPGWLGADGLSALDPTLTVSLLGAVLNACPEHAELTAEREGVLLVWARLALAWIERASLPSSLVPTADMIVPGLCRKAGLFDEGLAIADRARRERPSWYASTARGLLLRRRGDTDLACEAFDEAIAHEPDNLASYLEAADTLFEQERWAEARRYYDAVLAREPRHEWALPSALFCRWRERSRARFPDDAYPPELYELMRHGNGRAHMVYDAFRPYVGYVPKPHDALTNVLRGLLAQLRPEDATGGSLRTAITNVEAPSNLVLCRLLFGDIGLEIDYTHVATPDPREPVAPIAFAAWRREGAVLVPALGPPPRAIAEIVRELASAPFHLRRAWAAASRAAARLSRDDAEALLACVVHPPPLPEGRPPEAAFEWVPRVQLTVAFVLAHLAPEERWEGSVRRDALRSLLLGPMDWSTEAAVVALTELALDHPILELDVQRAFATLYAGKPQEGPVCYERTLLDRWLRLPGLYPSEREVLDARWDELTRSA